MSKVPEKLHCALCNQFLLNAFKTACCEGAICEKCKSLVNGLLSFANSTGNESIAGDCPICHHQPFISNPSKAIRNTARMFLKKALSDSEVARASEVPSTPTIPVVGTEQETVSQLNEPTENNSGRRSSGKPEDPTPIGNTLEGSSAIDISNEVLPSVEVGYIDLNPLTSEC